jgi:hypothetical protein
MAGSIFAAICQVKRTVDSVPAPGIGPFPGMGNRRRRARLVSSRAHPYRDGCDGGRQNSGTFALWRGKRVANRLVRG